MNFQDIIRKKRDGHSLSKIEIDYLVKGISDGSLPDYQIAAWAMAVYFQGMDDRETRDLAIASLLGVLVFTLFSGGKGIYAQYWRGGRQNHSASYSSGGCRRYTGGQDVRARSGSHRRNSG